MNKFLFWYKVVPLISWLIGIILTMICLVVNRLIKAGKLKPGFNSSINMGIATSVFIFLWGFNLLNLERIAIPQVIIFAGSFFNMLAVIANGGYMPVHMMGYNGMFRALNIVQQDSLRLGRQGDEEGFSLAKQALDCYKRLEKLPSPFHKVLSPKTRLKILCDWIPWAGGTASLGDVLLTLGFLMLFSFLAMDITGYLWN